MTHNGLEKGEYLPDRLSKCETIIQKALKKQNEIPSTGDSCQ